MNKSSFYDIAKLPLISMIYKLACIVLVVVKTQRSGTLRA